MSKAEKPSRHDIDSSFRDSPSGCKAGQCFDRRAAVRQSSLSNSIESGPRIGVRRMDVSEARRGQRLEIGHKEIARRNTQALVTVKTDYHLATPLLATPGEALGESVDLIVVATGKREQLSDEFFQPSGAPGKTDRSSGEQIGLGNQSSALVGVGLRGRDVDGVLAQTLNETKADGEIFDQKRGRTVPPLELHDLSLQRFERNAATPPRECKLSPCESAARHVRNTKQIPSNY